MQGSAARWTTEDKQQRVAEPKLRDVSNSCPKKKSTRGKNNKRDKQSIGQRKWGVGVGKNGWRVRETGPQENGDNIKPEILTRWSVDAQDERRKFCFLAEFLQDPSWGAMEMRETHTQQACKSVREHESKGGDLPHSDRCASGPRDSWCNFKRDNSVLDRTLVLTECISGVLP